MSRQAPSGWLTEDPRWPINIGMNALVAAAWLAVPALSTPESTQRLLAALINAKGVQAPPMEGSRQNNQLQGWSWTDATFSWVEPTAWALLALKRARRGRLAISGLDARIDEAERLLIDRVCAAGGWNFGNPMTMGLDLAAYVPTTAVVLLAMQDRITVPAVARSLDYLAAHGADEQSSLAMGLAVAALRTCGRRSVAFERQLTSSVNASLAMSVPSRAIAALALSPDGGQVAFGI